MEAMGYKVGNKTDDYPDSLYILYRLPWANGLRSDIGKSESLARIAEEV